MKAIILEKPGQAVLRDVELPALKEHEVLLRVMMSGICTNDVRDFHGECPYSYPRIGGHEYCGVIEEVGREVDTRMMKKGLKAVSYIIDDCKTCYYCKRGEENICQGLPTTKTFQNPNGLSGYGGFAQYVVCKEDDIFLYPDDTSFEKMAFTEPLACVVNSVHRTRIRLGDDILVIGGGAMGLLHVMVAVKMGARVILSEPLARRREKALSLGCHDVIDPVNTEVGAKVRELTGGRGAAVVFNTTPFPDVAKQAVELTSPGGTCVMFSSLHPNEPVPVNMGAVHSYQITVTGAVSPTIRAYQESVLLIGKGLLDPTALIERIYDDTEFEEAIKTAEKTESYKVLLRFGDERV